MAQSPGRCPFAAALGRTRKRCGDLNAATVPPDGLPVEPDTPQREAWQRRYPALARFVRNKLSVLSAVLIVSIFLIALLGPVVYPVDPAAINNEIIGEPQKIGATGYILGSDNQGRDMLARLLAGARISLAVGVVSCLINLIIGVGVGVTAGWLYSLESPFGRTIDTIIMRCVDILYSIPLLLVVVLLQIFVRPWMDARLSDFGLDRNSIPLLLSPDLVSIYLALGVTNWLTMARLTRGEVISQAKMDYVMAARSLGVPQRWILIRHVLPNCVGPLAVAATLAIPEAIFVESFLAYVGIGVSAPQASWGTMASDGLSFLSSTPHQLLLPAIAISITMLSFNLFGDGLRDALDPSKR